MQATFLRFVHLRDHKTSAHSKDKTRTKIHVKDYASVRTIVSCTDIVLKY